MTEIEEIQSPHWIFLQNSSRQENRRRVMNEARKSNHGTVGKYLFFSDDKIALKNLAKEILVKYDLFSAKIPATNTPKPSPGYGFVLCVYDYAPRLKMELKRYGDERIFRYRYWKSDAATLRGEYSKEYKESHKGYFLLKKLKV